MMMACGGGRNPTQSNLTRRDEFLDRFAIAAAHPTDPSLIVVIQLGSLGPKYIIINAY
jgi:hypothetical protein